jgi:SsrA-binding protein
MYIITENRRARYDYNILDVYEAGIELFGFEVKAIKIGKINISSAYVLIKNNEAWLVGADITPYQKNNIPMNYDQMRSRRLLLKKSEIKELGNQLKRGKGLTLLPLKVYIKNRLVKIELGLARGKKKVDKREVLRQKEATRELRRLKLKS